MQNKFLKLKEKKENGSAKKTCGNNSSLVADVPAWLKRFLAILQYSTILLA